MGHASTLWSRMQPPGAPATTDLEGSVRPPAAPVAAPQEGDEQVRWEWGPPGYLLEGGVQVHGAWGPGKHPVQSPKSIGSTF